MSAAEIVPRRMPTTLERMSRARVPRGPVVFGGWRGELAIEGDVIRVRGDEPSNQLEIDLAQVKRCSFNSKNGLWAFRLKDGRKAYVQTSGLLLSADRSPAGRDTNNAIRALLKKHRIRGVQI